MGIPILAGVSCRFSVAIHATKNQGKNTVLGEVSDNEYYLALFGDLLWVQASDDASCNKAVRKLISTHHAYDGRTFKKRNQDDENLGYSYRNNFFPEFFTHFVADTSHLLKNARNALTRKGGELKGYVRKEQIVQRASTRNTTSTFKRNVEVGKVVETFSEQKLNVTVLYEVLSKFRAIPGNFRVGNLNKCIKALAFSVYDHPSNKMNVGLAYNFVSRTMQDELRYLGAIDEGEISGAIDPTTFKEFKLVVVAILPIMVLFQTLFDIFQSYNIATQFHYGGNRNTQRFSESTDERLAIMRESPNELQNLLVPGHGFHSATMETMNTITYGIPGAAQYFLDEFFEGDSKKFGIPGIMLNVFGTDACEWRFRVCKAIGNTLSLILIGFHFAETFRHYLADLVVLAGVATANLFTLQT